MVVETVRVEVPLDPRETVGGLMKAESPLTVGTMAERLTVPASPFTLVTVMVDEPEEPATSVSEAGDLLTVKSPGGRTG